MKIEALNGHVILKEHVQDVKLGNGILAAAPTARAESQHEGIVHAVEKLSLEEFGIVPTEGNRYINVGDHVFYNPERAKRIKVGNEVFMIVPEKSIIARVSE